MLEMTDTAILCVRNGRAVPVARVGEVERYAALRVYGVKANVAAAITANICYVRVKA